MGILLFVCNASLDRWRLFDEFVSETARLQIRIGGGHFADCWVEISGTRHFAYP